MPDAPLTGSVWILWLYDVCEEINLEALRKILGVEARRDLASVILLRNMSGSNGRRWCSVWSRSCSRAAAGWKAS